MGRKIFVIEDDHACEKVLCGVIRQLEPDATIQCEESAEKAIAELTKPGAEYDLIIADIYLAGKGTGLELWETCRKKCPKTPILITSGMSVTQFFDAIGHTTVAPTFLPKPFYPGECRQIIEGLLSYT